MKPQTALLKKVTHELRKADGTIVGRFRVFNNGSTVYCSADNETIGSSKSPSLGHAIQMGRWDCELAFMVGYPYVDSLPKDCRLVDLDKERATAERDALLTEEDETFGYSRRQVQRLINSGSIWRLEGAMGRATMRALEAGHYMLGKEPCHDYWGNFVPSREMVLSGTKGSFGLVAATHGREYANALASVE